MEIISVEKHTHREISTVGGLLLQFALSYGVGPTEPKPEHRFYGTHGHSSTSCTISHFLDFNQMLSLQIFELG